jgi:ribosomal protein L11 methyltransferase
MNYWKYVIACPAEQSEMLLGLLSSLPFEAFEETHSGLDAYLAIAEDQTMVASLLEEFQAFVPFTYTVEEMEDKNWNAIWESNFSPVRVADFCGIRASFHPPFDPPVTHEIRIDPKMAFGTGHHATTCLVIKLLQHLDLQGHTVLDYGCGTGILAILAEMLGASRLDAVDIEEPAYENTLENVEINGAEKITVYHGTLEVVPPHKYDLILANINRNVILNSFPEMKERLESGGRLIISGFLVADLEQIVQTAHANGLAPLETREEDGWIGMLLTHS